MTTCSPTCRACASPADDSITVGDLTLDYRRAELISNGYIVPIAPQEYRLINWLIRHPNMIHSHASICEEVWPGIDSPDDAATRIRIRIVISRLRKKLLRSGITRPALVSRYNMGYGLMLDRELVAA